MLSGQVVGKLSECVVIKAKSSFYFVSDNRVYIDDKGESCNFLEIGNKVYFEEYHLCLSKIDTKKVCELLSV